MGSLKLNTKLLEIFPFLFLLLIYTLIPYVSSFHTDVLLRTQFFCSNSKNKFTGIAKIKQKTPKSD